MRTPILGLLCVSFWALFLGACAAGDPYTDGEMPTLDDRLISALTFENQVELVQEGDLPAAPASNAGYPVIASVGPNTLAPEVLFSLVVSGSKGSKGDLSGILFKFDQSAKVVFLRGTYNPGTGQMVFTGSFAAIAELSKTNHHAKLAFWIKTQEGSRLIGPYANWNLAIQ